MRRTVVLALLLVVLTAPISAAATRHVVTGGWYIDACVGGAYVALITDSHLETHVGRVALPDAQNVLYLSAACDGSDRFAGVGGRDDRAYEWTGIWSSPGMAFGVNAVIYDATRTLRVAWATGPTGSQGWRYVADDGRLVTGDESYADPINHLWEYTVRGDIRCGQGGDENGLQCLVRGRRVLVAPGVIRFIRFRREGDRLALAWIRQDTRAAAALWLTVAELEAYPTYTVPGPIVTPPPPPDDEPEPEPEPQTPDKDHAERIVTAERAKFGPMNEAQIAAFLRHVAARVNAEGLAGGPFGVLVKTSGNNCLGYSCDIICAGNGSAQRQWDVLGDSDPGGAQRARWTGPLASIAVRPCEVVLSAPTDPEPDPEPDPDPDPPADGSATADLQRRQLALLVQIVAQLEQQVIQQQAQTAALEQAMKDLKAEIAKGIRIRF